MNHPATLRNSPVLRRINFENKVLLLAIGSALPGAIVALALLWGGDHTPKVQWTITVFTIGAFAVCVYALRERLTLTLQTLSNLLAALREGDYSVRARTPGQPDALAEVIAEVNALGETLREQRLDVMEATALLRTVMAEIDVAIFAFDQEHRLRLVNRAGEKLLHRPVEQLIGRTAGELGLGECLTGESGRPLQMNFPGGSGRWGVRKSQFRQNGLPHQLMVLSDLSRELRDEERQAWQRLVRVLGHELNNSLAPIKSIAGSLQTIVSRPVLPADWHEDLKHGLEVIHTRADALNRFIGAYAQLARLPQPRVVPVDVSSLITRVSGFETRIQLLVKPGSATSLRADPDQLEQLLINLVRNAVDSALDAEAQRTEKLKCEVSIGWTAAAGRVEIWVADNGVGVANSANLFVPFFTTKPKGSGIGLVLSRQIAEAHGGRLTLENQPKGGCIARLWLPST